MKAVSIFAAVCLLATIPEAALAHGPPIEFTWKAIISFWASMGTSTVLLGWLGYYWGKMIHWPVTGVILGIALAIPLGVALWFVCGVIDYDLLGGKEKHAAREKRWRDEIEERAKLRNN